MERLNNEARQTIRGAGGMRRDETSEIAMGHAMGELPEPNFTR